MKKWDIGESTCGREILTDSVFEEYKAVGIGYMEISLKNIENYNDPDEKTQAIISHDANKIKLAAIRNDVTIWSLHLPFGAGYYDISCEETEKWQNAVQKYSKLIEYASDIGAKIAVLHPSFEPIEDSDREERLKLSTEALYTLSKVAKKSGVKLAVENLPRTCLGRTSDEIIRLISADDSLGVCFDVNHLLIESHKDFVHAVGNKIITVHISDYDFIDERHWLPGKGKIDWKELIGLLKEAGYDGPFMNEVTGRMRDEKSDCCTYEELFNTNKKILDCYF